MDIQEAALATAGTAVGGNAAFSSVSTDSRAIQPGQLFVALRGERFDAHAFVSAVAAQGAAAAMVDRAWAAANPVPSAAGDCRRYAPGAWPFGRELA